MKLLFLLFLSSLVMAQTPHSASIGIVGTQPSTVTGNSYYQSTTSGGPYTIVSVCTNLPPTTKCSITSGLVGSTTYYWVATAICSTCNAPKESGFSNQVSGTTQPDAPPSPQPPVLGNPTVSSMHPPTVTVPWKPSTMSGVTLQKVWRQTGGAGGWIQQKQLKPGVESYADLNVRQTKAYAYKIEALKGNDVSMTSKPSLEVVVK
jgi:hypothetical protein